jgi:hypothetical protein
VLEEIKPHLSETWFPWMDGFGDNDVFMIGCTVRCCLVSLTWRAPCALLNTFGESAVTPPEVGGRFTFLGDFHGSYASGEVDLPHQSGVATTVCSTQTRKAS